LRRVTAGEASATRVVENLNVERELCQRLSMKKTAIWAALGVVSLVFAWSCGDDGTGDAEPTLEELPDALIEALCPELESCLGENGSRILFGSGGCAERLRQQLEDGDFQATIAAVEAGRVRYDGSQVKACLASFNGLGCGFQTRRSFTSEACVAVLEGDVEPGGDCALDEECKGSAFCKRDGNSCPGTCSELLEAGDTCTKDDECADGLTCASNDRCIAPGRLGEACGRIADAPCAAGLVCIGADTGTAQAGECSDPEELYGAQLGEECDLETPVLCEEELACAVVMPIEGEPRLACQKRVEIGDACTFGAPSQCPDGSFCSGLDIADGDLEGTCAELPDENDECNVNGGQACDDGLHCGGDTICHGIGRLGDGCTIDDDCASAYCDDGTCTRPATCAL
jgi:hypothetical protein